jgi:hypothetical protein
MTSRGSRIAAAGLADPTHLSAVDTQDQRLFRILALKGPGAARRCIKQARKRVR